MDKRTYKNESGETFRFDNDSEEKIMVPGKSLKLVQNDYLDGLVAQGLFSVSDEPENKK